MKIIIATIKSWNIERAYAMQKQYEGIHEIRVITKKERGFNTGGCIRIPTGLYLPATLVLSALRGDNK